MNKKFLILLIFIIIFSSSVLAWFPNNHIYISLVALRTSNTPITQECEGRENLVLLGEQMADVFVVHYLEGGKKITTYIGSHSRGFYDRWMELAGSDLDLKCVGRGIAFHNIQDQESHYNMVPKDIGRYKLPNVLIHPAREQQLETDMMNDLNKFGDPQSVTSYGEVDTLSKTILDIFDEDPKYLKNFAKATGLREEDIKRDIDTVNINLKGNSWNEEVYGKKVSLPLSYLIWLGLLLLISFSYIWAVKRIGKNNWKYVGYFFGFGFMIFLVIVIISVPLGTSWYWYKAVNSIPAGLISPVDYKLHLQNSIDRTVLYLKDGVLKYADASGLSYTDKGRKIDGALTKADKSFKIFILPIILGFLVIVNLILFLLMSRKPKK